MLVFSIYWKNDFTYFFFTMELPLEILLFNLSWFINNEFMILFILEKETCRKNKTKQNKERMVPMRGNRFEYYFSMRISWPKMKSKWKDVFWETDFRSFVKKHHSNKFNIVLGRDIYANNFGVDYIEVVYGSSNSFKWLFLRGYL